MLQIHILRVFYYSFQKQITTFLFITDLFGSISAKEIPFLRLIRNFSLRSRQSATSFAFTRQSVALLEQVAVCVAKNEPVLLVGETGTGKTSCVQFLSQQMGELWLCHFVVLTQLKFTKGPYTWAILSFLWTDTVADLGTLNNVVLPVTQIEHDCTSTHWPWYCRSSQSTAACLHLTHFSISNVYCYLKVLEMIT